MVNDVHDGGLLASLNIFQLAQGFIHGKSASDSDFTTHTSSVLEELNQVLSSSNLIEVKSVCILHFFRDFISNSANSTSEESDDIEDSESSVDQDQDEDHNHEIPTEEEVRLKVLHGCGIGEQWHKVQQGKDYQLVGDLYDVSAETLVRHSAHEVTNLAQLEERDSSELDREDVFSHGHNQKHSSEEVGKYTSCLPGTSCFHAFVKSAKHCLKGLVLQVGFRHEIV